MLETPQWLKECPLEPVPPIDMKTVYIGEAEAKEMILEGCFRGKEVAVSIYVEVDEYFDIG